MIRRCVYCLVPLNKHESENLTHEHPTEGWNLCVDSRYQQETYPKGIWTQVGKTHFYRPHWHGIDYVQEWITKRLDWRRNYYKQ